MKGARPLFATRRVILGLSVLGASFAFADTASSIPQPRYFQGRVGNSKIWFKLAGKGTTGAYFYEKHKLLIKLKVKSPAASKALNLESDDFETFHFKAPAGKELIGTWSGGDKTLPSELHESTRDAYIAALAVQDLKRHAAASCDGLKDVMLDEQPDLNGDGRPERSVACREGCGATGNCPYELYLSFGKDLYFDAGDLSGIGPKKLESSHNGLPDMVAYWKGGCVGMEGTGSILEYDGSEYLPGQTFECDCEAEKQKDRSPHCPGAED